MSNPCTDVLSDSEYLHHMIPHHQVAIDMSEMLLPISKNPEVLHLCRNIIRNQRFEIWEMNNYLEGMSDNTSINVKGDYNHKQTKLDVFAPKMSKPENGDCDPLFFKPNDHMQHMQHMKLTDNSYLRHMIPHHQVAVDMSKRLLLHTTHSYLIEFCKNLIIEQQGEIFYMNNLLQNRFNNYSELLQ